MAQMIHDLVPPAVLTDFVRTWDSEINRPTSQWVLDQYLPNRLTEDLEYRIRKGQLNDVDIAEYRAWDTPPSMAARPGTKYIQGSLGPVSRQIPLGEEEMLRRDSLLRGNNDPIVNQIFEDATNMMRAVQGRIELARGDLIDDGAVTISENGLTLTADFGRAALMSKTAGTVWTNTAASILTDELAWQIDYIDQNGIEPETQLMSKVRIGNFALNTEMRSYAAANGTTPTRINRATIDNIFATEGLPGIVLNDEQVRIDGTATKVLDANKVYFMPPAGQPLGNTFYGVTSEALLLRSRGLITAEQAPGVVAVVLLNENPVQTYTLATAIALPAMPNPDLVLDADVA